MNDPLERFALLAGLSQAERRVLSERLEWLDLAPGSRLFEEAEPAAALLLVLEGRIRLTSTRRAADGELGPGSALGALSLVVEGPREATAEARVASRVLRLSRRGFESLRASHPQTACRLLEGIVRESALFVRDALSHLVDRPPGSH